MVLPGIDTIDVVDQLERCAFPIHAVYACIQPVDRMCVAMVMAMSFV